jgi:hypothetical protein
MGFTVNKEQLADYGFYLSTEAGYNLPRIERLARDEGMSDHGFTGLLEPLGNIVNGEASVLVGSAFSLMQRKLCDLGDSVLAAAEHYGYVDEDNRSLFERNGLGGDNDERITSGHGYGNGDGYDRHLADGSSQYKYAELEINPIDRPDTKYTDDLEVGPVLTVLDWIWSEFSDELGLGEGGKGFTDTIISPLAGNYNSIRANGEAWKDVGKNLGLVAASMGTNATTLGTEYWQGDASEAFKQFLDLFWTKGAVWAGEQLGTFISLGFDKLAKVSEQIAQLAINAIQAIIRAATRIATKAIPVVGWAWTAIQSAAKYILMIFGVDIDDLYDDIMEIVNTAKAVWKLFDAMRNIVETMQNYFNTVEELLATVKSIPEVGSLTEAADIAGSINDNVGSLNEQKTQLEQNLDRADDALTELDDIATGAESGR